MKTREVACASVHQHFLNLFSSFLDMRLSQQGIQVKVPEQIDKGADAWWVTGLEGMGCSVRHPF